MSRASGSASSSARSLPRIVIGILAEPELPELLRWVFFYLFLFSIGYSVGPQFFGSLKKAALPQIVLARRRGADGPGDRDRRHGGVRLRRRHRRRPALGRHDAVGRARHRAQRDCRAADPDGDKGAPHGQRAAGRRDHLRLRRSRADPVPHVARSEAASAPISSARPRRSRRSSRKAAAAAKSHPARTTESAPTGSRIRRRRRRRCRRSSSAMPTPRLSVQRVRPRGRAADSSIRH